MFYDVQKIIFNDTKNGERNESEMIGTERVESSRVESVVGQTKLLYSDRHKKAFFESDFDFQEDFDLSRATSLGFWLN